MRQAKLMIMQLQLDIYKGVPRKKASIKFKRSMKILLKDMVVLYKGLPNLREDSQHGYQMQRGAN